LFLVETFKDCCYNSPSISVNSSISNAAAATGAAAVSRLGRREDGDGVEDLRLFEVTSVKRIITVFPVKSNF